MTMLKIIEYKKNYDQPIVLLLGYFDCMHIGHRKLLKEAEKYKKSGEKIAIFTFSDSFLIKDERVIYTLKEREGIFSDYGADIMLVADFDEDFKNQSAASFLDSLNGSLNIKAMVCGFDYRFGSGAKGDTDFLKEYCKDKCIKLSVLKKVEFEGEKASSTLVKELLKKGDIERANRLLGGDFFITGVVKSGRKVGRTLGFPTANITFDSHKAEIKEGVYLVYSLIGGKVYKAISNYGKRPTFNNDTKVFEVFFHGYDGSLYGENIKVYFKKYIREVTFFDSAESLKKQITKDMEYIND